MDVYENILVVLWINPDWTLKKCLIDIQYETISKPIRSETSFHDMVYLIVVAVGVDLP